MSDNQKVKLVIPLFFDQNEEDKGQGCFVRVPLDNIAHVRARGKSDIHAQTSVRARLRVGPSPYDRESEANVSNRVNAHAFKPREKVAKINLTRNCNFPRPP